MSILKRNRPLFALPPTHPARRFLEEFIACRKECVGREIALPGEIPIDQAWFSATEGKPCTFSSFAYTYLAFDVVLDDWLQNSPRMSDHERHVLEALPKLRSLMLECESAAKQDANSAILPLVSRVKRLLDLWEDCIVSRLATSNKSRENTQARERSSADSI